MQVPPADSEAQHLSSVAGDLRILMGQLTRRLREAARPGELTGPQVSVIDRLEREGPATVTRLARAERVRPQSMSATVAGLEAIGLVSRAPDRNDGRATILSITVACRELIKANRLAREDWLLHSIRTRLTFRERSELASSVELLKRLADA
jgi:DNA-binding MarR family transcriptional regulator